MSNKTKKSIKASDEGIKFLKNLKRNRVKVDTDEEGLSYWELLELIGSYFKKNNERYLELVNMPGGKNV